MSGLNPTSGDSTNNWNYSRPNDPGFSLTLIGTVVAMQEVQAMNFGADGRPTTPKFWENTGQPVWNIRMVFAGPSGGFRTWTFQPAGKAAKEGKVKSVHLDLFELSDPDPAKRDMNKLIGRTLKIETQAPPQGFNYGRGNPRPWQVSDVSDEQGPFELSEPLPPVFQMAQVLANGAVSGGVIQQMPSTGQPQTTQEQAPQAPTQQAPQQVQQQPQQPQPPQQPQQGVAPSPMPDAINEPPF